MEGMKGMEGREKDLICRIEGKPPSHTKTTGSSLPFLPRKVRLFFSAVAASARIGSTALPALYVSLFGRQGREEV